MVRQESYGAMLRRNIGVYNRLSKTEKKGLRIIEKYEKATTKANSMKTKYRRQLKKATGTRKTALQDKIDNINKLNRLRASRIKNWKTKIDKNLPLKKVARKAIRKPYTSTLRTSRREGYFIRHKIWPLLHITEEDIPDIKALITQKYNETDRELRVERGMSMGDNTIKNIKMIFSDSVGDHITSKSVRSLDEVEEVLVREMSKHNASAANAGQIPADVHGAARIAASASVDDGGDWYDRYLMAVDFFMYNMGGRVGCSHHPRPKFVFHLSSNELLRLYCPKASDNRCFDMCLIKGVGSKKRAYDVRRKAKINPRCMIDPKSKEGHKIADEVGVSYRAFIGIRNPDRNPGDSIDKSLKLYTSYIVKDRPVVDVILIAGHCYLVKDTHIYTYECSKCGDTRVYGLDKNHKCKPSRVSFYQKMILKNDIMDIKNLRTDKTRNWVFFDLETLPCGKGETHQVYAVGWYDYKANKYHYSYGKEAMSEFMGWVEKHHDKKYIAFNGCRFDFYFLQNELIKDGENPKFMLSAGRLLSLKWPEKNKVWDICNFMPGYTLKKACEAFKTKTQKGDFDHKKMKDWSCVDKYKEEVLPYLKADVISLKQLTETFVNACETDYLASPTEYLTLSSYAENVWKNHIRSEDCVIEVPDMEKQNFIARSVYGGRTYPSRKKFKSSLYDEIISYKEDKNKCKKLYKKLLKSKDYIYNGDINSQYPACMAGCDLMPTLYPTGRSKWIKDDPDKCEETFLTNKQLGIYEIEFSCPNKKIRHPPLPRKKIITRKSGKEVSVGVDWSLLDGKGVYNTIDIQNAIKHGYHIKFTGRALIWKGVSNIIFKTYVDTVYANKVDATREDNQVKRAISKLMMNSLYGKMLQRPMNSEEVMCKTIDEVEQFSLHHTITDWEIVEDNSGNVDYVLLTGEKIQKHLISRKPRHLGSFVLGYSRRLWLKFIETIDPTLTGNITTYQDTDSLHILGKYYDILKDAGMIDDEKLGYLSNDCKNDALIIREINLSPKCYMYVCLDKDGNIQTVKKSKGIGKDKLQDEWYENDMKEEVEWTGMKKVNKRVSKADRAAGVENWSVKQQKYTRTFNKNKWTGMKSDEDYFYPYGYESS